MRQHRARCRQYKAAYKAKLENKLNAALTKDVQECERVLDIFNITLVRRQAEMEVGSLASYLAIHYSLLR